jgi:bis(5'-nucleosyl)-tetraphosphatase (symmetrical)
MSTYIIGDIHGCYDKLVELLNVINFDFKKDKLILTGDLVGRGNKSLEVIQLIMGLGNNVTRVLGNHDLNLVSLYYGFVENKNKDKGLNLILTHKNAKQYIEWISSAHLTYIEKSKNLIISHAGIPPLWSIEKAVNYSFLFDFYRKRVGLRNILKNYHLNKILDWNKYMSLDHKLQYILFGFTKMKYCKSKSLFDNVQKGYNENYTESIFPWFKLRKEHNDRFHIYFGHWAALGFYSDANVTCCDSGCVWNGKLNAIKLEPNNSKTIFYV